MQDCEISSLEGRTSARQICNGPQPCSHPPSNKGGSLKDFSLTSASTFLVVFLITSDPPKFVDHFLTEITRKFGPLRTSLHSGLAKMVKHSYVCELENQSSILLKRDNGSGFLKVSFERTIRVPDNSNTNALPPSLGQFPLYKTQDYVDTLPKQMAAKGGLFLPMYRKSSTLSMAA